MPAIVGGEEMISRTGPSIVRVRKVHHVRRHAGAVLLLVGELLVPDPGKPELSAIGANCSSSPSRDTTPLTALMNDPISRRGFLASSAGLVTAFGFDLRPAQAAVRELKISRTTQTLSVCPYCAVGCSVVIHTLGDKSRNVKPAVVHIEGNADSPVNRGTLCSKGASLKEFVASDRRLTQPLYRAPGAVEWTPMSWEEAIPKMARLIKKTRDAGFQTADDQGRTVNRLSNLVMMGGCTDTNEVNYLLGKLRFALGVLPYENQARL